MKTHSILFTLLFSLLFTANSKAQLTDSMKTVKVLAKCIKVEPTGKRHQSFFFTFKIEKVLEGSFSDTLFKSSELPYDFGGGQILRKVSTDYKDPYREVIIKLVKTTDGYNILWISEPEREKTLENLEQLARTFIKAIEEKDYNIIKPFVRYETTDKVRDDYYNKMDDHYTPKSPFTKEKFKELITFIKKKKSRYEHNDEEVYEYDYKKRILDHLILERTGEKELIIFPAEGIYVSLEKENSGNWFISGTKKRKRLD